MTASPASSTAKSASVWEDFVDIFYAPSQVYERRRDGRFGLALVIVTVLMFVVFAVTKPAIQPALDAQVDRAVEAMRKNPQIPPDRLASAESMARKSADVGAYFGAVVITPVRILLAALGLWLIGKFFGSKQSYRQAAMVATYAFMPIVLGTLLAGLAAFFTDPEKMTSMFSVTLSPARFAPPGTSMAVLGMLSRIDIFVIWSTVLLAIGLAVTGNISRRSAGVTAAILWVIGTLLAVGGASRQAGG